MKKDFILPILVLSFICLFMSGALAGVNAITQPVIEDAANQRAAEARKDVMPQAEDFVLMDVEGLGLPGAINMVYKSTNDVGFVFVTTTTGYGGDVQIICGIGTDGKITKTATLAQSETQGISTPVFAKEPEYVGKDKNFKDSIDVVTGATLSSNAYRGGIQAAFEAFEIVKGVK